MMPSLPAGPLVEALGWALLHLVWIATLVAGGLALVLAMVPGRSRLRYVLSCLALVLIVALGVGAGVRSRAAGAKAPGAGNAPSFLSTAAATAQAGGRRAAVERVRTWAAAADEALPLVVTLWLSGVLLSSVRLLLEWLRIRRLVSRGTTIAPEPWPAVARRLAVRLGLRQAVRVLESAAVDVPSVVGLLRPAILIPAGCLTGLSARQLEMILAHELAHVRRYDFFVNLLQTCVETLLFYHPAVWWVSRQIRLERENCCDDLAVAACGDRLQYARALLRLEELRAGRPALAMSADGGSLLDRIRRIAPGAARRPARGARAAGALAIPLFLLVALVLPALPSLRGTAAAKTAVATVRSRAVADAGARDARVAAALPAPRPASLANGTDATPGEDADHVTSGSEDAPDASDPADDVDPDPSADPGPEDGRATLDDLIALKVQGVTPDYIREIRALLGPVSLQEIAGMKAVGVSPASIRDMRRAGIAVETPGDATGLAALGVTREFVREMRSVGFPVLTASEAQGLKAVGVSAEYVRAMRRHGLVVTPEEAQGMAALGVRPEDIDEFRDAGVDVKDAGDLQGLKALGITPAFVRRLARAGYRNLDVKELQSLAAAGVNGDFIREMSRYRTR